MSDKFRALSVLVDSLFDYSGMFPPEAKSFEDALVDSAKFSSSLVRKNMVNADFVIQLSMLDSLNPESVKKAGFKSDKKIKIAVLGSEVSDQKNLYREEIEKINTFNHNFLSNNLEVTSFEIKVDTKFLDLESSPDPSFSISLEPDLSKENWKEKLKETIKIISPYKKNISLKFRGTGPTGIDNKKIAYVISLVCDSKIRCKATGGLHHPILEAKIYGNNLGFINLTTALYLRYAFGETFGINSIEECLNSESMSDFKFEQALSFKDFSITLETLKNLKEIFRFSIGSCSLREPDEDLVRLIKI